jgi:Family of unknown function (DUF6311)
MCLVRALFAFAHQRLGIWGGSALGLGWFYWYVGAFALNPTDLSWVMTYPDGASQVLGWLFFRHEPWRFPLGALSSLCYPVGTMVAFTDSIPWLAMVAKLLSPVLPVDFQYLGLWLGLCFMLQGYCGAKIVQAFSPVPLVQFLGGAFFIFDPVLIKRIGHTSLSAHWIILGLICLHLRQCPDATVRHRMLLAALGACLFSAGIHPYLAVMVWALSLSLLWRFSRGEPRLRMRQLVGWGIAFSLALVGVFTLFGYLGSNIPTGAPGFGAYSADLLTLVNPMGGSYLLPTIPTGAGQAEGYGYLGGGALSLSIIGVLWIGLSRRLSRSWWPQRLTSLTTCCLLFALYALSSPVTMAGVPLLTLEAVYRPFADLADAFRASGRFIWPLHYLVMIGGIGLWIRAVRHSRLMLSLTLAIALAVQLADAHAAAMDIRKYIARFRIDVPNLSAMTGWKQAAGAYDHLVLYPPQVWAGTYQGCVTLDYTGAYPSAEVYFMKYFAPLTYYAYRLTLTFNSGYVARINAAQMRQYCEEFDSLIHTGNIREDTIYVVHDAFWEIFPRTSLKVVCGRLSVYIACVSDQRHNAFRNLLEYHKIE